MSLNDSERDFELHEEAGLVPAGVDEEGNNQWIGTDKQWQRYTELTK